MKRTLLIPTIGCAIIAALLRVTTWNEPHGAVAEVGHVLILAALTGMVLLRGPGVLLGAYGPRAITRRGKSSLILGLVGCLLFLPPLLWIIYTHWLLPMNAAMNEVP